jgi:hypothetical protein
MRRSFDTTSNTPSSHGIAPPEMPVPAPRVTTGTPAARHSRTTSPTCASVSGSTASSGVARRTM